ncbi:MAG: hypothetical protein ACK54T_06525 [bacterium]
MNRGPDIVEIPGLPGTTPGPGTLPGSPGAGATGQGGGMPGTRPFLRLFFRCANAYCRAYKNPDGTMYLARCPRCGQQARFAIGPDGSNQRSFEMSCGR